MRADTPPLPPGWVERTAGSRKVLADGGWICYDRACYAEDSVGVIHLARADLLTVDLHGLKSFLIFLL